MFSVGFGYKLYVFVFHVLQEKVRDIVNRFAYVKQTAYGMTFDVVAEPQAAHLANTGRFLEHHTDLNYREKAPGLQLLHCLKVTRLFSLHIIKTIAPRHPCLANKQTCVMSMHVYLELTPSFVQNRVNLIRLYKKCL